MRSDAIEKTTGCGGTAVAFIEAPLLCAWLTDSAVRGSTVSAPAACLAKCVLPGRRTPACFVTCIFAPKSSNKHPLRREWAATASASPAP